MNQQDYAQVTAEDDDTGSTLATLPTPSAFVARLEAAWQQYDNTPSQALRRTWQQVGECFNRQVTRSVRGQRGRWQVLQGRTGTAKTLSLAVWSALLIPTAPPVIAFSRMGHPGVLIVTKLIQNASGIAAQINSLAREYHGIDYDVALDWHSKNRPCAPADLKGWPVLVVTHAAFQIAMGEQIQWQQYHAFAGQTRRFLAIDESLELIEDVKVEVDEIRAVPGSVPIVVALKYPREMAALEALKKDAEFFCNTANLGDDQDAALVHPKPLEICDLTPLRAAIAATRFNREAADPLDDVLERAQIILNQWAWFSAQKAKTVNTASFLIPESILTEGAVVLDATASTNMIYKLLGNRVEILPRLAEPRTYRKATLWVSFGHRVGKGTMGRIAKDEAHVLVENLRRQFSPERKVFVGLQLIAEDAFDVYRSGERKDGTKYGDGSSFARFDVAHYGETDGVNTFNADNVAVIFGLNYPPQERAVNLYNALVGLQLPGWFAVARQSASSANARLCHSLAICSGGVGSPLASRLLAS